MAIRTVFIILTIVVLMLVVGVILVIIVSKNNDDSNSINMGNSRTDRNRIISVHGCHGFKFLSRPPDPRLCRCSTGQKGALQELTVKACDRRRAKCYRPPALLTIVTIDSTTIILMNIITIRRVFRRFLRSTAWGLAMEKVWRHRLHKPGCRRMIFGGAPAERCANSYGSSGGRERDCLVLFRQGIRCTLGNVPQHHAVGHLLVLNIHCPLHSPFLKWRQIEMPRSQPAAGSLQRLCRLACGSSAAARGGQGCPHAQGPVGGK